MADNNPAPGKDGENQAKVAQKGARGQRVISNPDDVARLVMMQIDAINARKDDLTIAIKGLTDTTRQLVRAYAQQAGVIQAMRKKIEELEEKADAKM